MNRLQRELRHAVWLLLAVCAIGCGGASTGSFQGDSQDLDGAADTEPKDVPDDTTLPDSGADATADSAEDTIDSSEKDVDAKRDAPPLRDSELDTLEDSLDSFEDSLDTVEDSLDTVEDSIDDATDEGDSSSSDLPDLPDEGSDSSETDSSNSGDDTDVQPPPTDPYVSGELKRWHVLTFTFPGPGADEADTSPNPFMDYRLNVTFTAPSGATFAVPGFFNGDGNGGSAGAAWQIRFRADEEGIWNYTVSFRAGDDVAISLDPLAGSPMDPNGLTGAFFIEETDKVAPDFRATGRIEYTGDSYLHTQDGAVWLKGGADSPENFLGYAGFDNTVDQPNGANTDGLLNGVHQYQPHVSDWMPGDPDRNNGQGKAIIGALNYLGEAHVNSIYFLPCNLGGDGRETYPYVDPADLYHLDLSKLAQWELVLAHAQTRGIALHVVLSETESGNENLHDNGTLGPQRKLFYRELAARFAHHPGLFWNIGEENDYGSVKQKEFAAYLRSQDPYDHPTTVHTHWNDPGGQYNGLLGDENFEMTSIQFTPTKADQYTEQWRKKSADSGKPWAVMLDEISPANKGVTDKNAKTIRKQTLWPAYLSGAAGVEWYMGYHSLPLGGDMRLEDFRTRKEMWKYTWIARLFMAALPVTEMTFKDALLGDTNGQVFYKKGSVYAVYLPNGGQTTLKLSGESGIWALKWYNVNTGEWSEVSTVTAGSTVSLGNPAFTGDVAALIQKQ